MACLRDGIRLLTSAATGCIAVILAVSPLSAAVELQHTPTGLVVTGERYRAQFTDQIFGFDLALRDAAGQWKTVTKENTAIEFSVHENGKFALTTNARIQIAHRRVGDAVIVGVNALLDPLDGLGATLHF
ncbi:MAG: hypothetical protein FJ388_25425, partial [Verrucomicrobia bacterium]|nr:hypothetical protein [Verrucomicrobiota bacterium]